MSVVVIATLDTKSEEVAYVTDVIEATDTDVHLVDVGTMGTPEIEPHTDAAEVASAAGTNLEMLRDESDRGRAVETMGEGAAMIACNLYEDNVLDGVFGLGGSGNTSISTTAMRALPFGVPKVVVSTQASGNTEPYVDTKDIAMFYSVADIEGINSLTETVLSNACRAMVGMVSNETEVEATEATTIGVTMFGVTTPCVQTARAWLEERGYEVVAFHATGTGGRAMETLVEDGVIDAVLDVTTTEWADEYVGGNLGAGPDRMDSAGDAGIPQVVSTGALDMVNFGPMNSVPEEFRDRTLHMHNPQTTLMRTNVEENREIGRIIAEKLNAATGPTALALPLDGVSMIDRDGKPFCDEAADEALFDSLREHLNDNVALLEIQAGINDEEFSTAIAEQLDTYIRGMDGPS